MPIENNVKSKKRVNTKETTIKEAINEPAKLKYSDEAVGLVNLHHLNEFNLIESNNHQDRQLKLIGREHVAVKHIEGCIVALGSNYLADTHLAQAREHIQSLVSYSLWSTPFINPDYTATPNNPKPDYTNQCSYLIFKNPISLIEATQECKKIEQLCKRLIKKDDSYASGRVSIDIDILAISSADKWFIIKQRYPFKAHERIGINELINASTTLNNQFK